MNRRDAIARLVAAGTLAPFRELRAASSDVRSYGLKPDARPEVNAAALQRCFNDNRGGQVSVPGAAAEYQIAGPVTVSEGTTLVLGDGARLRWVSTAEGSGSAILRTKSRPGLEVMGGGFRLTGRGQILGPSRGVFVPLEIGLLCVGGGRDNLHRGFEISDGVEFRDWGSHGIAGQFVQGLRVHDVTVRDCGYAGMQFLSCQDGQFFSNHVVGITPGADGNAYGMSFTHDSFEYSSDPNAERDPRHVKNPFCTGIEVAHNVVEDVPLWCGIDFHGAYECHAHNNEVYNCRNGLTLQGSSGMATGFAGENNSAEDNTVTINRKSGEPSTITSDIRLGVSVNGGKVLRHRSIIVKNNTIDGYGDAKHTSFALQHTYTENAEISSNHLTRWRGYGCYSAYSSGVIAGNRFGPVLDPTGTACIMVAIGGALRIVDNRLDPQGGRTAQYGLYLNTPADAPYDVQGNDFRAASVAAYTGPAGHPLLPRQLVGGRPR